MQQSRHDENHFCLKVRNARVLHHVCRGRCPALLRNGTANRAATVHLDAVEHHAACRWNGYGKCSRSTRLAADLCEGLARQRDLRRHPHGQRRRLPVPQRPALSAIPPWPPHRMERRLEPSLALEKYSELLKPAFADEDGIARLQR